MCWAADEMRELPQRHGFDIDYRTGAIYTAVLPRRVRLLRLLSQLPDPHERLLWLLDRAAIQRAVGAPPPLRPRPPAWGSGVCGAWGVSWLVGGCGVLRSAGEGEGVDVFGMSCSVLKI